MTLPGLPQRRDGVHGVIDLDGDQLGMRGQCLAQLRWLDAPRMPFEQLDLEKLLEPPDALAESGLGDVELVRGPAEVPMLHGGQEMMDLAQLHATSSEERIVPQKILVQEVAPCESLSSAGAARAAAAATWRRTGLTVACARGGTAMTSRFLRHRFLAASGGLAGLALVGMLGAPNGAALAEDLCPERGSAIKAVDMNYSDMDPTARSIPSPISGWSAIR